jgi:predicted deacylase
MIKRLPIAQTTLGTTMEIVLHEIEGAQPGPTLGMTALAHGDEFSTIPILRTFLERIDRAKLKGRILAVPVASPRALADFSRYAPEFHGNLDVHQNFPGKKNGTLGQMTARVITDAMLDRVDTFIDLHAGGQGGRTQFRIDFDSRLSGEIRERVLTLCRSFGTTLLHASGDLAGTSTAYCNERGVPTVHMECGGIYLDPESTAHFERLGVDGLLRVAKKLGMIDDAPQPFAGRQLVFDPKGRVEVNPINGGYLESYFTSYNQLEQRVDKGTLMGRIIDPYTLAPLEDLVSPCAGLVFTVRPSGMIEAGGKAYGVADEATSTWL